MPQPQFWLKCSRAFFVSSFVFTTVEKKAFLNAFWAMCDITAVRTLYHEIRSVNFGASAQARFGGKADKHFGRSMERDSRKTVKAFFKAFGQCVTLSLANIIPQNNIFSNKIIIFSTIIFRAPAVLSISDICRADPTSEGDFFLCRFQL